MQVNSFSSHSIDIVCFSLMRWDAPVSSPAVSFAKEFSRSSRVFFIEHPYSLKDYLKEKKTSATYRDDNVLVVTPPLVLPVNFLPEGQVYGFFSGINRSVVLKTLRELIKKNNISRYIFINFFDPFFLGQLTPEIKPEKYIYHCMDDISQVSYTRRHGLRLEEEIIRQADLTFCTSSELTKLKSALSSRTHYLPNGADTQLFSRAFTGELEKPSDMDFPGKRIIGYMGSIEYRTDFGLLKAVALQNPEKIICLIGPVSGGEHLTAGVQHVPNIIFCGPRPLEQLPAYLQNFDCAIIPFKKNTLTKSIYPLKINEYLAAGKPVVTTNFSEDIYLFRDNVYIADSPESFSEAINTAIREDSPQKKQQRANAAADNSWKKRAEQFWKVISQS